MTKTVVMRDLWYVSKVDAPDDRLNETNDPTQVGWYYTYTLPPHDGSNVTMEHGPFPTKIAALLDAEAAFPANWILNGDG
ncbi:MAG TPA: hypothetical protein VN903_34985 [Polyangia bacterium]|nr:hypothetical protein [Polyangia bacterium]